ncbi:AAA family ATPase [Lentzea sp. BCCO 10_0061]|uniref:AAA family ATPase n=1 Tax=Lentzea sokolovensis TaxID=3095429 RepID=A0ABU4VAG8_9PSEU|nr:trypsin-like peptidase domain-containing protein [Lentzea sp. BCCO 10_0061]MDX8148792.1 AAA family ATPase [Lentzea sp. BCCO 10_0061]
MHEAAHGVVQTGGIGSRWRSTAWLITDSLVVMPDHATTEGSHEVLCFFGGTNDKTSFRGRYVYRTSSLPDAHLIAVFRLNEPHPGRALRLGTGEASPGRPVVLLHHPLGAPLLHFGFGRVLGAQPPWLRHDVDTQGGSGGGPVLDLNTRTVLGMHTGRTGGNENPQNQALSLATILELLRNSPVWNEIAEYHGLADVSAARLSLSGPLVVTRVDNDLVPAAMRWSFDPQELPASVRDRLRPLVGDPDAPRWSLLTHERQRLINSAGTLAALREARGRSAGDEHADQRTIDRILAGPPYSLAEVADEDLPYWLQAVRWFAAVAPDLPSPAAVHQALERRRVRSRLHEIAGVRFRGRRVELTMLRNWFHETDAGPMVVTGIGGIGKSALVARFAEELLPDTLLLWLDFDRADLAADDARSVLGSLSEQAHTQLDDFETPRFSDRSWQRDADLLAGALTAAMPPDRPVLLVLDGFEVAQYARRHQEIWPVLERLRGHVPQLRILVSGRAPVPSLMLAGRLRHTIPLLGLPPEDARSWLADRGITDPAVLDQLVVTSRGIPLVLKLAIRLIEMGGDVLDLPESLPKALIEGYLYQRIVDRVIDPALRPLVRDALVLRTLTADVVREVLGEALPRDLDPAEAYSQLSRELGLVEDVEGDAGTTLRLRPEVRTATLRLLEADDLDRVRKIDRRAADWYASHASGDASAAELVYHLLRLGDVPTAQRVWTSGCAPLLRHAVEEIPENEPEARAWLRRRTDGVPAPLTEWENDAASRISAALARDLDRAVPEILRERPERSKSSALVLYDAWLRWRQGDIVTARRVLAEAGFPDGPRGRDRAILGAMLAREDGDREAADRLLARVDSPDVWPDSRTGRRSALAARAARVRLTVDLRLELELAHALQEQPAEVPLYIGEVLRSADVVLPSLTYRFMPLLWAESVGTTLTAPKDDSEVLAFASALEEVRLSRLRGPGRLDLRLEEGLSGWGAADLGLDPDDIFPRSVAEERHTLEIGLDLAVLARRRWHLASSTTFISDVCEQAQWSSSPLSLAAVGTLAACRGLPLRVRTSRGDFADLDEVIRSSKMARLVQFSAESRDPLTEAVLKHEHVSSDPLRSKPGRGTEGLALYLLGPDPLDLLHRRALGLPLTPA